MKESDSDISLTPEDEMIQASGIISSVKRAKQRGQLDLVYLFKSRQHCAIKIFEWPNRQTHLAVAFAQTEYDINEKPESPLEIKVDSQELTYENLQESVLGFLANHFPEALSYKINFFCDTQSYKNKTPLNTHQQAA